MYRGIGIWLHTPKNQQFNMPVARCLFCLMLRVDLHIIASQYLSMFSLRDSENKKPGRGRVCEYVRILVF
jgi:hypothetical protein